MSAYRQTLVEFFTSFYGGEATSAGSGDTNAYQAEYEATPHKLTVELSDDVEVRKELLFPDGSAYVLHNLLTPAECAAIQQQATEMGLRDSGYSSRIRVCERVSAMGHALAAALFERARPHLGGNIEVGAERGDREPGVPPSLEEGVYEPYGLNPCFRIVRYAPGGFFFPHFDGGFERSASNTSIKTFMMYLNEGFEGGPTNFYKESQQHYKQPDPANVIHSYRPRAGSCLVFNHRITHDGGELISGEKWLFRSEVMYKLREKMG